MQYHIHLSFKGSEKWIFDWLKQHSSPSATIKDVLKQYIEAEKIKCSTIDNERQ